MNFRSVLNSFKEQPVTSATAVSLLLFACANLFWRLSDYSGCFSEVEVFANWLPSVLLNGKGFSFSDFSQAIDAWGMDGDSRPRFLSYYLAALTIKTRIALWDWLPPHPSFSPLWPFTLVMAPWLLYLFLKAELECRWSAITGTSFYMLSTGYLSSATMLFHPGKPLANVAVIATLYVAMKASKSLQVDKVAPVAVMPRAVILFYLVPLPVLLMADETALYCLFILPVWAHRYFIPRRFGRAYLQPCLINWFFTSFPALVYLAVVFLLAPLLSSNFLHRSYSFGDYLTRYLNMGKTGLFSLVQHTTTLFSTAFMPWWLLNRSVPIAEQAELSVAMVVVVIAFIVTMFRLINRNKTRKELLVRLTFLVCLFLLFQTFVAAHHRLDLTITGYYYGAIFSILVSILFATTYETLVSTSKGRAAAVAVIVYLAAMQSMNYSRLNSSWLAHRNFKCLDTVIQTIYNPYLSLVDVSPLAKVPLEARSHLYAEDIPVEMRSGRADWVVQLWRRRNDRMFNPHLQAHLLALEDLWILSELYYWRTSLNTDKVFSGNTPPPVPLNSKLLRTYRGVLGRVDYSQGAIEHIPLLAFQNITNQNRETNGYETKLAYPLFSSSLESGLQYLRKSRYNYILITDDTLLPYNEYSVFHNQFMGEMRAGRLYKYGIISRGNFVLDGHTVTLLQIL